MKCVILCMCCNNPLYLQQYENIIHSWGEPIINGQYENIDIWGYTSSNNTDYNIDVEKHMIYVPSIDGLNGTFDKTLKALTALKFFNIQYDCILRTNCSTIINVKMLHSFINSPLYDYNKIYSGEIFINADKAAPDVLEPISRGNLLLFNEKYASIISETGLQILKQYYNYKRNSDYDMFNVDDITICGIFNTYFKLHGISPFIMYSCLPIQYLDNIYVHEKEKIDRNTFAFFNKSPYMYDQVPIENYYDKKLEIFIKFINEEYNELNDDLDILNDLIDKNTFVKFNITTKQGEFMSLHIDINDILEFKNEEEILKKFKLID